MALLQFDPSNMIYIIFLALSFGVHMGLVIDLKEQSQMFLMFIDSIILTLFLIPELIHMFLRRKEIHNNESINSLSIQQKSKYTVVESRANRCTFLSCFYVFLVCILQGGVSLMTFFLGLMAYFSLVGFYFFFNFIFTSLLLLIWKRDKMHKHHLLAFAIIVLSLFLFCIFSFDSITHFYLYMIRVNLSLFIIFLVLLLYEGIGSFIICLIAFTILQFIEYDFFEEFMSDCNWQSFLIKAKWNKFWEISSNFMNFKTIVTLKGCLYVISTFCLNYFRILINRNKGPSMKYTSELIGQLFCLIFYLIYEQFGSSVGITMGNIFWYQALYFIPFIIACLIYNENVRIYIWKFAENTKYEIALRSNNENTELKTDIEGLKQANRLVFDEDEFDF